jgi:hypothetical protein
MPDEKSKQQQDAERQKQDAEREKAAREKQQEQDAERQKLAQAKEGRSEDEGPAPEIEPSFSPAPDPESRSPNFAISEPTIVSGTQEDQQVPAEPLAPSEAAQDEAEQKRGGKQAEEKPA